MKLELGKVNRGQQLAAVGAVLLFVFLFIGWYSVGGALGQIASSFGVNVSVKGWDAHSLLRWLMLLTIVGAIGLAFLNASGRPVPRLPVSPSALLTALAALTVVLLAFRMLIDQPGPDELIDLKFGAWVGLASLLAITAGGWLSMQAEGLSVQEAGAQFRSAVETATQKREGAAAEEAPPESPGAPDS